eukprot:g13356.t1
MDLDEEKLEPQVTSELCWAACVRAIKLHTLGEALTQQELHAKHILALPQSSREVGMPEEIIDAMAGGFRDQFQERYVLDLINPANLTNREIILSLSAGQPVLLAVSESANSNVGHIVMIYGVQYEEVEVPIEEQLLDAPLALGSDIGSWVSGLASDDQQKRASGISKAGENIDRLADAVDGREYRLNRVYVWDPADDFNGDGKIDGGMKIYPYEYFEKVKDFTLTQVSALELVQERLEWINTRPPGAGVYIRDPYNRMDDPVHDSTVNEFDAGIVAELNQRFGITTDKQRDLAGMVKDPIEVQIHADPGSDAKVSSQGGPLEGLDIDVQAESGADVEIKIEGDLTGQREGETFCPPRILKYVLNVYVVGLILLLPVVAGALYLLSDDSSLFIPLLIVDVGLLVVLMIALCRWAILYYKHICETLGHKEGMQVVSAVASGLSEAFPAAIIALGIGGTAAYLENQFNAAQLEQDQGNHQHEMRVAETSHQNEMALEAMRWRREQSRAIVQELTSYGYGSIYYLSAARERMVWMKSVAFHATETERASEPGIQGLKKVYGLLTRQFDEVYQEYEAYATQYSTTMTLDTILAGVINHFGAGTQKPGENSSGSAAAISPRMEIADQARAALAALRALEQYPPATEQIKTVDDPALWDGLYVLHDQCVDEVDQLRTLIQQYAAKELN